MEIKFDPNNNKGYLKLNKTVAGIWKNFRNFLKVFYLYLYGLFYPHF